MERVEIQVKNLSVALCEQVRPARQAEVIDGHQA